MKKILKDVLLTGLGGLVVSVELVEELIAELVKKGDISHEEGKKLLENLLNKSREESERISKLIIKELEKKLSQAGFVTKDELGKLQLEIDHLKEEINQLKYEKKNKGD